MPLMCIYSEPSTNISTMQIGGDVGVPGTVPASGCGFQPEISVSNYPARNYPLASLVLLKFCARSPLSRLGWLFLLITKSHLPFMCLFSDPQSPPGERRSKRGTCRCRILLLRLTARWPTGCERYWTLDVVAGLYSTSLTGRGTVLRNAPGSGLRTSWIPLCLPASIVTILTDLLPDSEEDPVDVLVLASGAARRGGAMSWDGLLRPPLAASDPSRLNIRTSFPSVPLCNHPRLTLPSYLDYN